MYTSLLGDPYFQVSAMESILSWLQDETARVEDQLLKPDAIDALLKCFVSSKANSFENLLDPFLKITRISTTITTAISKSSAFFKRIIDRLGQNSKAVVRLNLLRILRGVCDVHPNKAMLVERYGLLGVVEKLSRGGGDGAVLVRELAREIVPALKPALKPATSNGGGHTRVKTGGSGSMDLNSLSSQPTGSSSGGGPSQPKASGLAPKRLRRAASEASTTVLGSVNVNNDGILPRLNTRDVSGTGGTSKTRLASGSTRPASATSRQRLGDIPWQNANNGNASPGWK